MDFKPKEIVVEIAGSKNQQVQFRPLDMVLRGRWTNANIREVSSNTEMGNLPDIPGIYLCLDVKGRTLRAVDPLGFPEFAETLREANRIIKPWLGEGRPWDTTVQRNMTETEIKSAIWEVYQLVEGKKARMIHGELPNRLEILGMPGELRIRWGTLYSTDDKGGRHSPYATPEELEKLGAAASVTETVPAGA